MAEPLDPNGQPNADALRPWANGMDVTRRPAGKWIINFGWTMSEAEADDGYQAQGVVAGRIGPRG